MANILVADDEPGLREFMTDALELDGHTVMSASDGAEAVALLDKSSFDSVFTDLNMPKVGGIDVVRKVVTEQPETQVVVLTAHGTVDVAVEAMKLGAFDFLQKPLESPDALNLIARRAIERRQLIDTRERVERATSKGPPLTHGAASMKSVVEAIRKVAPTAATVLLLGESGTGKEVAAKAIHDQSDRRDKPFMALNCAAVTAALLESELFGHEKGAFTGAEERHRGRVELAAGGTFFLDEIGELKSELQAKLLRVLQEKSFERVGGTRTLQADVRWIAATNRDLRAMIADGTFREDLYHRLAVFPVRMPPLRDRAEDLVPIARQLVGSVAAELGRASLRLDESAERKLAEWHWPGNIRELRNALERAAILADGTTIMADNIWLDTAGDVPKASSDGSADGRVRTLLEIERDGIERALAAVDGNRRKAAEMLGIGERTLYDKIKRHDL